MHDNKIDFIYVEKPKENFRYRRTMWMGIRSSPVLLSDRTTHGNLKPLHEELNELGYFPCLITWNTETGITKYAEARNPNARPKKSNHY